MSFRDFIDSLGEFWRDFSRVKSGLVGLGLLIAFILLGIFGPLLVPFSGAVDHWRDIAFWQDNPRAAPPAWTNFLAREKGAVSAFVRPPSPEVEELEGARIETWTFPYRFDFDRPPRDIVLRLRGSGEVPVSVELSRPDGLSVELWRDNLSLAEGAAGRISFDRDGGRAAIDFVRDHDEALAAGMGTNLVKPLYILFSRLEPGIETAPVALKGDYEIAVKALVVADAARLEAPELVVSGDVAGILGTDISKRDVFTGLIIGIRWALIIGLLTSIVTVLAGVFFGVTAAYFGGVVDWVLNRIYELLYLMPVLPFLIVVAAIFKPTIWTLIVIICLFFWTGPYKPAYSMALQIREETYVEASKAIGSGRWRIVFKHIVPILLPYSFAVMALSIPGVIVYEASVSLLGLGDATIVTWGQLLNDALNQGAVINDLWWWVVPPGLMIALMGMSFAFLGTALDKILHPKLRTR